MILRRLVESLRSQDWFTVTLELLIVVTGIFVGLQANDWNRARQDRSLERVYLERLSNDLRSDIAEFTLLEDIFRKKAQTLQMIRDTPATEIASSPSDNLALELDYTTWKALPKIQSAAFDELSSTGRLVLLRDTSLRHDLSEYYADYDLIANILAEPDSNYRRLFFGAFPGEVYFRLRLEGKIESRETLAAGLVRLKTGPDFEAEVNIEIAYAAQLIFYLSRFRASAEGLLQEIEMSVAGKNTSMMQLE
jgi:hypothetical protein